MAIVNYMALLQKLSPAALTVRTQALPPTDQGKLLWDSLMPRENVDSVDLNDIITLDYRPTADRREWNARGRLIPLPTPTTRKMSMVPIESRDRIDEYEMQTIMATSRQNQDVILDIIGAKIPQRVDRLADSDYRRLEVDTFNAWLLGQMIQRNPSTGATYTASYGIPTERYVTAGTAWNDVGQNAYDLLQTFISNAQNLIGPIEGAMMRENVMKAILADAPNLQNSVKMTRSNLEERISDDAQIPFRLVVDEETVGIFDDGGLGSTKTKRFLAGRIAAIPQGGKVGYTAFAPVVRAMDMVSQVGLDAGIDIRGTTVYYDQSGTGRDLQLECQLNALPVPVAELVYVENTLIA